MSASVVRFESASKTYHSGPFWAHSATDALHPTDFEIGPEEMVAMVGESGSGKTTFGRLCLGLAEPTTGRVLLEGERFPANRRLLRGRLAAVLQNPSASLDPHLRVGASVTEPILSAALANRASARLRACAMLDRVGLSANYADRFPHELSGGQRQRVAIARALVTSPRLIVFDEAVSALDMSVQAQILNLIRDMQRETGFSGLFITHDLAAARYVADRVAVMRSGRIVHCCHAADLYAPAPHEYTRQLQRASGLCS
jgi:peptide/nickel transport system ATP-binding protein